MGQGPSYVHSSADGITWSLEQQLPFNASFHDTLNGKAVVAGANAIWIDGVASAIPTRAQIYAAAGVDVSTVQGENWADTYAHIFSVAYGGGFYVAVGAMVKPTVGHVAIHDHRTSVHGSVHPSVDQLQWSSFPSSDSTAVYGVGFIRAGNLTR